ncbi:Structural maintenance of chromosomes protein 1, partial [Ascosphaera atra]
GVLAGLEQKIAFAREEVGALERNVESKSAELKFAQKQVKEARPRFEEKQRGVEALDAAIDEVRQRISGVEDKVYNAFCRRLGFSNIREYEAQQGSLQQEAAQKRLEFVTQRSRIESQLAFEQQKVQGIKARVESLKAQEKRDRQMVSGLEAGRAEIQGRLDRLGAELEALNGELETQREAYARSSEELASVRQQVQKRSKKVEGTLKAINALEGEAQRVAADRYALLRRCKLEDIDLPLAEGSKPLDALPIDDLIGGEDPEAMDVDEEDEDVRAERTEGPIAQDYGIEVNFDELGDTLKEVSEGNSFRTECCCRAQANRTHQSSDAKLEEELLETIRTISAELDKMAPNMRAMERLEGVESKLVIIEREFDEARKRARRCKEAFEDVMRRRSELFNKAFQHISEQIEPIYRDLTKTASYPMGGKA